ncbi:DUF3905 domain-containing protein [Bacillus kexueae]|uniref:DUF3905 domain-containing protein n=1 Tax=Aeribacillus kexueae TaxID=2078952 RepID=UPI001FAFF857|nr:DUF3905 domain-containing protein [Bacillus kexueae]
MMKKGTSFPYTLPHQMNAPNWEASGKELEEPFINQYGVMIGDSDYDSEQSPLNHWSDEIDPAIMSGDEWVHPTNDIGWNTPENRQLVEKETLQTNGHFMHPNFDVGKHAD